ncbi:hypothetical protein BDZ45DRAFT_746818 [Acephala macrosclerotiorum]|nr:hypothetical protein BDZ45DRAFT_746818 [Acephala macrosclerotiorum]
MPTIASYLRALQPGPPTNHHDASSASATAPHITVPTTKTSVFDSSPSRSLAFHLVVSCNLRRFTKSLEEAIADPETPTSTVERYKQALLFLKEATGLHATETNLLNPLGLGSAIAHITIGFTVTKISILAKHSAGNFPESSGIFALSSDATTQPRAGVLIVEVPKREFGKSMGQFAKNLTDVEMEEFLDDFGDMSGKMKGVHIALRFALDENYKI